MTPTVLQRRSGPAQTGRFDRRLLAPMIMGSILNPINSSIIAVSLVPIGAAFGAPPSQTAWLVSALYLATAIGQPVVGRMVDTYGPRSLFLVGTALTGVAGVVGTLAPNLWVLVLARVILGFGTCAGYPAAMYLIRSENRRTGQDSPAGVLTALAVSSQTIAVVGPTLGGLLIGLGGWRTTLAVNIPLALVAFVLGARRLPRGAVLDRSATRPRADVVGIVSFAAMLTSLLLFLMQLRLDRVWLLAVTVVAGAVFAVRERREADPFIDVRVLAGNAPLLATYARALLAQLVGYCFLYGYTQWLEDSRGLSASRTGLVLLPMFATGILVSTVTGRHAKIRGKLVVGALAQVAACVVLLGLTSGSSIWVLVGLAVLLGLPQGLTSLANQNAVYHQADGARIGASSGLFRTFTYGGAIGASAATGAFFGSTADTSGLHALAAFMTVVGVLLVLLTLLDRSLGRVGLPAADPRGSS